MSRNKAIKSLKRKLTVKQRNRRLRRIQGRKEKRNDQEESKSRT